VHENLKKKEEEEEEEEEKTNVQKKGNFEQKSINLRIRYV
jgi:hypothetical protein